jgi:hypothetical protein
LPRNWIARCPNCSHWEQKDRRLPRALQHPSSFLNRASIHSGPGIPLPKLRRDPMVSHHHTNTTGTKPLFRRDAQPSKQNRPMWVNHVGTGSCLYVPTRGHPCPGKNKIAPPGRNLQTQVRKAPVSSHAFTYTTQPHSPKLVRFDTIVQQYWT